MENCKGRQRQASLTHCKPSSDLDSSPHYTSEGNWELTSLQEERGRLTS